MQFKNTLSKLFKWMHVHRLGIVIILFLIVLPVTLVVSIYVGSYVGSQRVHFDEERTDATVFISDFIEVEDVEPFDLSVTWQSLRKPVSNDSGELIGGYYTFNIRYAAPEGSQISNVMVTPVLQTPWSVIRYLGQPIQIVAQDRVALVSFNHELPFRPLWFVTVNDPILYLKITYTKTLLNQTEVEETIYVKMALTDLNPAQVITN